MLDIKPNDVKEILKMISMYIKNFRVTKKLIFID